MTMLANVSMTLIRTARLDDMSLAAAPVIEYLCHFKATDALGAGRAVLSAPARGQLVQGLDRDLEADRSIDVPLGDVEAGAVRDQRHADQQKEAQRQHFHRRVSLDEIGKGL